MQKTIGDIVATMSMNLFTFYPKLLVRTPSLPFTMFQSEELQNGISQNDFQLALQLATPQLYNELKKFDFDVTRLTPALKLSAFKYYNRMSYRSTPFGAFASVGLMQWGKQNGKWIREKQRLLLFQDFYKSEMETNQTFDGVELFLNPSLYELGNHYRYFFRLVNKETKRATFQILQLKKSKLVRRLVESLSRPVQFEVLADFLARETLNAVETLHQLIDSQFLYHSELPLITSNNFPSFETENWVKEASHAVTHHTQRGCLDPRKQWSILQGLSALEKLTFQPVMPSFDDFVKRFVKKFEGSEVPLLIALDPEAGISYLGTEKSALVHLSSFPLVSIGENLTPKTNWNQVSALLLEKLVCVGNMGSKGITLSEADMNKISDQREGNLKFPPSFSVLFRTVGDKIFIEQAGGNSAMTLAGRFSLVDEIHQELRSITSIEHQQNDEVVFAEITFMDDAPSDNVHARKHLRKYEIPLLVRSELSSDNVINLSDLTIQVKAGEVILRSKLLRKRVVPRLASAYNYKLSNLPLLHFLGDLQYQNLKSEFHFDPEQYLPGLTYYPTIYYKDCILSAGKWILEEQLLRRFSDQSTGRKAFCQFAQHHHLSRFFAVTEGDRQLVFDLESEASLEYFFLIVANKKKIILKEFFLPEGHDAIVDKDGERYTSQFLAFLTNKKCVYLSSAQNTGRLIAIKHEVIAKEWLYLKIYGQEQTLSELLLNAAFKKLVETWKTQGAISCWFFVWYADPDPHIRIRLKADMRFIPSITAQMDRLVKRHFKGRISGVLTSKYEPELQRYGSAGMKKVEKLFQRSSELVLEVLISNWFANEPVQAVACTLDQLLCTFYAEELERFEFISSCCTNIGKPLSRSLDVYYRKRRGSFEQMLLAGQNVLTGKCLRKMVKLQICSQAIAGQREEIRLAYPSLVADLLHMQVNRFDMGRSVDLEVSCYYLLKKYYSSVLAKKTVIGGRSV